jgi:hypothetical protein
MRKALSFALLCGIGCSQKVPSSAQAPAVPSTILYHTGGYTDRGVMAVAEDGSRAPWMLSTPGTKTQFVAVLPGRRVLLAEYRANQSIARLVAAAIDRAERQVWAELPDGAYQTAFKVMPAGDALAVALIAGGEYGPNDLYALRMGAAPALLARNALLVAADASRAAYLAGTDDPHATGDLRSIALDGTDMRPLGGQDGNDHVVQVSGGWILATIHGGDVRLVNLAGAGATIATSADEAAFALTAQGRIIFTRDQALVSAATDGSDERLLAPAAIPVAVTAGEQVFFTTADHALAVVGALGGQPRIVDPAIGSGARSLQVSGGSAVYVIEYAGTSEIRSARLDGSRVATLYVQDLAALGIAAVTRDGRVVFTVPIVGDPDQVGGGYLWSARLDGSELRRIGKDVATGSGTASALDQDFEAVTPSGRLLIEVEYQPTHSQLALTASDSSSAQQISEGIGVRFAGLVP